MRTSFIGFLVVFAGAHQLIAAADCENPPYGRCGGKGFEGNECCTEGYECTVQNDYYSQCVPVDNAKSDCSKAYEQCGGKHQFYASVVHVVQTLADVIYYNRQIIYRIQVLC